MSVVFYLELLQILEVILKPSTFLTTAVFIGSVFGIAALQVARSSAPSDEATATVGEDGTVATTGITLPGQEVAVPASCDAETSQNAKVVCVANAFLETLSDKQKGQVILPLTQANAVVWSNLPTTFVPRNGLELSDLSAEQVKAALAVVKVATGTLADEGYSEVQQLLMADDVLAASGGMQNGISAGAPSGGTPPDGMSGGPGGLSPGGMSGGMGSGGFSGGGFPVGTSGGAGGMSGTGNDYADDFYFLAFLGTPSTDDTWILQFGGHHLAVNMTYKAGKVASATPEFRGVEPKVWTTADARYAPLEGDHQGMVNMLASLSDEQLASAKLSQTFSDVLVGPDEDGNFPETKSGIKVSELSDEQKMLVLEAMKPWVQDAEDETAAALLSTYEDELDETYIAYSGDASLTKHADYVRIDGPSVWIELACQNGIVYSDQIHYHTIWRDHTRDYGAEFDF